MGAFVGLLFGVGVLLALDSRRPRPVRAAGRPGWSERRSELLRQAGLENVSPLGLLGLQVVAAVGGFVLVLVLSRALPVAVAFAAFGARAPVAVVHRYRERRTRELREVWPEIVDNLASGVRAGLSLPEALAALAVRGPEPLRPPFRRFGADYQVNGRFGPCLDRLKHDLADPVGDRIVEALRTAREVGGTDLGRLLRTLSAFLREDARTRSELETRQGWTVNAARLAVGAPWAVLLLLSTQTATITAYNSTAGAVVLVLGGGICFAAYRVMLRIGRLPQERRVLR